MTGEAQARLPGAIRALFWVQLVLAVLIFALGWSHTSSMTFGRTPSFADIVALGAPLVLVTLFWWGAAQLWRRGKTGAAWLLAFTPLLAALQLAMLAGMV